VELLGDNRNVFAEVYADEAAIGRIAAEHFLARGFKHFAYFSFGNAWWAKRRYESFARTLELFGHPCHLLPGMLTGKMTAHPEWKDAYEEPLKQWLDKLPKPIAIFGTNDLQAMHLLHACKGKDLRNDMTDLIHEFSVRQ